MTEDEAMCLIAKCFVELETPKMMSSDVNDIDDGQCRSRRYRIKINRIWREKLRFDHVIYPEVDNAYERLRSKIIIKFCNRKQQKANKKAENIHADP